MEVYILWHARLAGGGEEDLKLVGVYSTRERAEEGRRRACKLPGFKLASHGFQIDCYAVDSDYWREGFGFSEPTI